MKDRESEEVMRKYKYPVYGKPVEFVVIEPGDDLGESDYYEMLRLQGYEKTRIGSPFHYVEECSACVEILKFSKGREGSILELWDHNGCILEFFCKDAHAELDVIRQFSEIMKNLISVEYMNKKIYKDEKEEYESS
jgi:hypothetical protein